MELGGGEGSLEDGMGREGRVRPLHFQRSSAAKEGGQEGKAFSSLSQCPPPPNTQVPGSFGEKKLVCKHTLTSGKLPSSTPSLRPRFRGSSLRWGWGLGGELGMGTRRGAHACQEPARPQVFSSCDRGGDSTFRTPAGSSGR